MMMHLSRIKRPVTNVGFEVSRANRWPFCPLSFGLQLFMTRDVEFSGYC